MPPTPLDQALEAVSASARLAALASYGILDTPPEQGFDDIVRLATRLCATPVALVSLVTADRQWFKARIGFPPCETDLDRSVCKFALIEPDLLIVPDLTKDPRTRANPLVTDDPKIRFYAGAPLKAPSGHVLGSLCVIDTAPRPQGLTPEQCDDLRALGRQVVELLELRRSLAEQQNVAREREALVATQFAIVSAGGALDAVLAAVTEGALRAAPAAEGAVVELIQGAELEYRAVAGSLAPHHGLRLPLNDSFAGRCALSGQAMLSADVLSDAVVKPHLALRLNMRSAVLAPIRRAQQIVGVLKLQSSRVGAFAERDLAVARLFAGVASSGLTEVAEAKAQVDKQASEARWRGLFEQLQEGFILGEVIRDGAGRVEDWRYVEVNRAWGDLVGLPVETAAGRTTRQVFPGIEDVWVDEFAQVVETGQSITFTREVGTTDRWYEGRAHKVGRDSFVVLFLEVTERVHADRALRASEARKTALVDLGDRLREAEDIEGMAYAAAELMGKTLGAQRAGSGTVDTERRTVEIAVDWRAPGVASIAGLHSFSDYGTYIADLLSGQTVVLDDVATDERTRDHSAALQGIGIRSMVNMPLVEHGKLVAVFFIHYDQPHAWAAEDIAFVRSVADRTRVGIARARAEEQQRILNGELSHRLKNTLAMVLSIATQTLRSVPDQEPVEAFERRVHTLASAHDVLLQANWTSAPIGSVARAALGNFAQAGRMELSGPEIALGPRATLSLSLLLHELATNAAKYGALGGDRGRVDVNWRIDETENGAEVALNWTETGGPPVKAPTRRGFGSRLIRMGMVGSGGVDLKYPEAGFTAELRAPLAQVQQY